jgi:hypothetical protein
MATSFPVPKGFSAPDGVKEGKEFSEIASFKIEGGNISIISIGQDKTPVTEKEDKSSKPKGGQAAMKEQLGAMEDKKGSASMEDTETPEEQNAPDEEMD